MYSMLIWRFHLGDKHGLDSPKEQIFELHNKTCTLKRFVCICIPMHELCRGYWHCTLEELSVLALYKAFCQYMAEDLMGYGAKRKIGGPCHIIEMISGSVNGCLVSVA